MTGKALILKKKELTLIKNLAQKEYDLRVKKEVECELQALTDFLKNYSPEQIEQAYDSLNTARQELIIPAYIATKDVILQWNDIQYNSLDIS